jgi:hypothetical protein
MEQFSGIVALLRFPVYDRKEQASDSEDEDISQPNEALVVNAEEIIHLEEA